MGLVFVFAASTASLPGSNFEIDDRASLVELMVDPDTANRLGERSTRIAGSRHGSGQNDDSYQGGAKEDDACPGTTTGSIPNNKSDLKTFGAYTEPEADGPGFLNLFWHRVNDPSGTTLMDFELNQSSHPLRERGRTPIRTVGDHLIEYRIEQGGAEATHQGPRVERLGMGRCGGSHQRGSAQSGRSISVHDPGGQTRTA